MARVALVDADPSESVVIAGALRTAGHDVLEWSRARTALEALLPRAPDALIVGGDLPDARGLDLLARLRGAHVRQFPALFLSSDWTDANRGRSVGASEHLLRPITPTDLVVTVERLIRDEPLGLDLPGGADGLAFGRYALKRLLGRGSFGDVYEAFDASRGGPVALKVLAPSHDPSDLARFVREARILSRVKDAHVVAMLDAGLVEGRAFCAMRLVKGPPLEAHLRAKGTLSGRETLALLWGILRALHALARLELVHRDVTPRNVILEGGNVARPVLIDFGLAKRARDQALTGPDMILGTPGYIAPEVVIGAEADSRSDMFAAGVLAVETITGKHPFAGLRGMTLMRRMAECPVEVPPHLPPRTRAFLQRLTAIDPDLRPATPLDALYSVGQLVDELAESTTPPPAATPRPPSSASTKALGLGA